MDYRHEAVLLSQTLDFLKIQPDGVYIDGTVGGGGHSAAIYEKMDEKGKLLAIDFDDEALKAAEERIGKVKSKAKLIFARGNFADIDSICKESGIIGVDGILFDVGVSSYQVDNPSRGFSYRMDSRLDMRMDRRMEKDACTVINTYSKEKLAQVIGRYGEERWASRIAKFIVEAREREWIETTGKLVDVIKAAIPASARRKGPHPAKRTFQAIRIEVNREIENLEKALENAVKLLNHGGRICVITFHSLEDRVVKRTFRDLPGIIKCVTKKPVIADESEKAGNPRSRSAKLRVAEKIG